MRESDHEMNSVRTSGYWAVALAVLTLAGCGRGEDKAAAVAGAEDEKATIESLTENSDRHDGLFTLFVDRDDGTVV